MSEHNPLERRKALCPSCDGTGEELFPSDGACEGCWGTGLADEPAEITIDRLVGMASYLADLVVWYTISERSGENKEVHKMNYLMAAEKAAEKAIEAKDG